MPSHEVTSADDDRHDLIQANDGVPMKHLLNTAGSLAASILLLLAMGCQPGGDNAAMVVPDGMKAATFAVSGMV
jgi:hypothetical protein